MIHSENIWGGAGTGYIWVGIGSGYHFQSKSADQVRICAVGVPVTDELIEYVDRVLGLVYESQESMTLDDSSIPPGQEENAKRSFISVVFTRTYRFELLRMLV